MFQATPEQDDALLLYRTANDLVIEAAAGTGKTSTLELLAKYAPQRSGYYLAFNKSVAVEAGARFAGTSVAAMTMHSLARRHVYHLFGSRMDTLGRFTPWGVYAKRVGIDQDFVFSPADVISTQRIRREQLTRCVLDTVAKFTSSADAELSEKHVSLPKALVTSEAGFNALTDTVVDFARTVWADWMNPAGDLPIKHDTYLKAWQLSNPVLPVDFVMLDEAQDADGIMLSVLEQQQCQRILVGDESQAIYSWRGATNGMNIFPDASRTKLTQSFRFGQAIAEEAQKWLDLLGSEMRIQGNPDRQSEVTEHMPRPDAVICRTNAGAITQVFDGLKRNVRVGIAGERKAQELVKLAKAAVDLKEKGKTSHPDFQIFGSFDELKDFAKTEDGKELDGFVQLVQRFSGTRIVDAIEACSMNDAQLVVSTAHIAKGLEWGSVRVADDFIPAKANEDGGYTYRAEEARLAYVTVTRAKFSLHRGKEQGLGWIDDIGSEVELV